MKEAHEINNTNNSAALEDDFWHELNRESGEEQVLGGRKGREVTMIAPPPTLGSTLAQGLNFSLCERSAEYGSP